MIISIINNKGGVGKTTVTVNLAHAIANRGKKVLVIDHDPQSNTTSILTPPVEDPNTLYSMYSDNVSGIQCIYPTPYENVDILPNEPGTATLELEMYKDVRESYHLLRENIREYALKNYDIVLIDCPPNLGLWVVQALVASDCAIIPIESGSRYSIDGFVAAYDAITAISQRVNHGLKFLKAVVNKVDLRASISRVSVDHIRKQFGDKVFKTTLPVNTDIQKAEADKETIIRHSPQSSGAKRFRALADEIIELVRC
jgi:chromosome partitioning protein